MREPCAADSARWAPRPVLRLAWPLGALKPAAVNSLKHELATSKFKGCLRPEGTRWPGHRGQRSLGQGRTWRPGRRFWFRGETESY